MLQTGSPAILLPRHSHLYLLPIYNHSSFSPSPTQYIPPGCCSPLSNQSVVRWTGMVSGVPPQVFLAWRGSESSWIYWSLPELKRLPHAPASRWLVGWLPRCRGPSPRRFLDQPSFAPLSLQPRSSAYRCVPSIGWVEGGGRENALQKADSL